MSRANYSIYGQHLKGILKGDFIIIIFFKEQCMYLFQEYKWILGS